MPAHIRVCSLTSAVSLVVFVCGLFPGAALAAPSITLSKKTGPPTSKILVSGTGFEPNVGVDIFFDTKDEALVVTDGKGEFHKAEIHAPRSAFPGKHWVTTLERNNHRGDQEPFVVNTNWGQYRFTPGHDGTNPYENVLKPTNAAMLAPRWVDKYGQVGATPAVVNGVIYVGAGQLISALNAETGAILWTQTISANVEGTPVVVDGIIYVAAEDFNLYALNAVTGALLWTYATDNLFHTSPAVVDGVLYFGSIDKVIALDALTGAFVWSYPMSFPDSPAVVDGTVYTGSGDGNFYALDASNGALRWAYQTTGLYANSPAVVNGVAYAGSWDFNAYALNANTGALLWKFSTNNVVNSWPAVADGVVYVTSVDTNLYALNAITGALQWKFSDGNYPAGAPAVANGVVYESFNGNDVTNFGSLAALDAHSGELMWKYVSNEHFADPVVVNGAVYADSYYLGPPYHGHVNAFSLGPGGSEDAPTNPDRPTLRTLHPDLTLRPSSSIVGVN
jgi:outer membrane protein assembly factor BamB